MNNLIEQYLNEFFKELQHTPGPWKRIPWDGEMKIEAKENTVSSLRRTIRRHPKYTNNSQQQTNFACTGYAPLPLPDIPYPAGEICVWTK